MQKEHFKYVYGPVFSWRLGKSLGVDAISEKGKKACSFDCIYCQAGRSRKTRRKREIFIPTEFIIDEMKALPKVKIDHITFSGRGEPTLARNLGEIIQKIKRIRRERIAVLTNASLIKENSVMEDLALADFVIAKLDVCSDWMLRKINRPARAISMSGILSGLVTFRSRFKGRFALQVMFTKENKECVREIAHLARAIKPDEIHINTPLRPSGAKPISRSELGELKKHFKGMKMLSAYDGTGKFSGIKKRGKSINKEGTLSRRGALS